MKAQRFSSRLIACSTVVLTLVSAPANARLSYNGEALNGIAQDQQSFDLSVVQIESIVPASPGAEDAGQAGPHGAEERGAGISALLRGLEEAAGGVVDSPDSTAPTALLPEEEQAEGDWERRQTLLRTKQPSLNAELGVIARSFEMPYGPDERELLIGASVDYYRGIGQNLGLSQVVALEQSPDFSLLLLTSAIDAQIGDRFYAGAAYTTFQSVAGPAYRDQYVEVYFGFAF